MRPVREISAEEENFRTESVGGFSVIRRDPVQPEPIGTTVLMAFQITGYDPDCDGSLMARLEQVTFSAAEDTGWEARGIGLYSDTAIVVTQEELKQMTGDTHGS